MQDTDAIANRSRAWLAGIFFAAGVMHFVDPGFFIPIVPPRLPDPGMLVAVSGAAELLGGAGLLIRRVRRAAGVGLILLLVMVFPANVYMLMQAMAAHRPAWWQVLLWARLPLQPVLIWWVWKAGIVTARWDGPAM